MFYKIFVKIKLYATTNKCCFDGKIGTMYSVLYCDVKKAYGV